MKHKIFRVLLSLVLVCVLLISWSPIRAQASILGGAALLFGDDAIAIILAVLAGLGVCAVAGSEISDLEMRAIARNAMDAMEEAGTFVNNGALSVYTSVSEAWSYAVSTDLVQWLHGWLYDSGVVSYSERYVQTFPTSEAVHKAYQEAMSYPYHLVFAPLSGTNWCLVGSDSPIKVLSSDSTGTIIKIGDYGGYTYHCDSSGKVTTIYRDSGNLHIAGTLGSAVQPEITTTTQANLGVVAPPGTDIQTQYREHIIPFRPKGAPDTGGDGGDEEQPEINVMPVPLFPPKEIPNVPQEDIWKGNKVEIDSPDSGESNDPTTGTDTEPGTGSDPSVSSTPWETFKKWISEGWQSIIQAIPTPEAIAKALGNVIKSIFVSDADFISEKWNAIRSRFDFADSISSSGELILDVLKGIDPEPPVIYVDLGDTEGSYYFGGQVAFLDLRWYERYKPTGDAIISAFLWLAFAWRLFLKLPGIISGLPGDFVMHSVVDLGLSDHLPARKKEYEHQRQENRRSIKK